MKPYLITATAITLAAVGTMAFAQSGSDRRERGQGHDMQRQLMMLGAADYNDDNTVTLAEFRRLQAEEFDFRDRDEDGYLTEADRSPTARRMAAMRSDEGRRLRRALNRSDVDEDRRISREEFVNREPVFFERYAVVESRRTSRQARREAIFWWRD